MVPHEDPLDHEEEQEANQSKCDDVGTWHLRGLGEQVDEGAADQGPCWKTYQYHEHLSEECVVGGKHERPVEGYETDDQSTQ